jgi:pyruvate,orthophosphate dikinase
MQASEGILTARGGLVSHAAVVARGWGIPAVVGAEGVAISGKSFTAGGVTVKEGDVISLDGTTGQVVLGEVELAASDAPPELDTLLGWADALRQGRNPRRARLGVRANADTGADAAKARELGAEGIGLCRTEHMFLGEDRLPIVREMILADTPDGEAAALEKLRAAQKDDFVDILEAMDGLPVTVRLLDPPLHEFLPSVEELVVREASGSLSREEQKLLDAARSWREQNPMLGTRGVRLGVLKPGLYAMQVRALVEAALHRAKAGGKPVIEIMIPLTVSREEMAEARGWVTDAIALALKGSRRKLDVTIGTMIETPRAALRADEIAEVADFFSFGTNDLTQMTFGFSRDDVEARLMPAYLERGLLRRNPFETIDVGGVGALVEMAVERGRGTNRRLKLGVCGEHGGDPASVAFFQRVGLDYVSCSPFRVPVARLAAAQAIVGSATSDTR